MTTLFLSCEHAVNTIPPEFAVQLNIPPEILKSHKAFDIGALSVCNFLKKETGCVAITGECSRLLIDLNRSPANRSLYPAYSKALPAEARKKIFQNYYLPYRNKIENFMKQNIRERKTILHFSIHSFTPVLNGNIRKADIGILYDPGRPTEFKIAGDLKRQLKAVIPEMVIRKNYPYRGISDGMTTYLRKQFQGKYYIGLEIEINQKFFKGNEKALEALNKNLAEILKLYTVN